MNLNGQMVLATAQIQEGKRSQNIKVLGGISRGRPGGYLGGRPGPKTFTPSLGEQENKVFCAPEGAEVHDPRGVSENYFCRNFSFPVQKGKPFRTVYLRSDYICVTLQKLFLI